MVKALEHIHAEGTFPVSCQTFSQRSDHGIIVPSRAEAAMLTRSQPSLDSKEDQNAIGACPVSAATIAALKTRVATWMEPGHPGHGILDKLRLCVFDGFLLYSKEMKAVQPLMDVKLFLRVSYEKAKARRQARSGYVTLEGFWEDPPGYVEQIVWPNYVEDHAWMFEGGDVEGPVKASVFGEEGIRCQEGELDRDMETTLRWAVEALMEQLPVVTAAGSVPYTG